MGYQIIIVMMLIINTGERGSGRGGGGTNVRPFVSCQLNFTLFVSCQLHDYK